MPRPRIYANDADKQRAYRQRVKLRNNQGQVIKQPQSRIEAMAPDPDLSDTRLMDWESWARDYLEIELLDFQVEDLEAFEKYQKVILNNPRQHGKTNYTARVFVIRKLCESVFRDIDEPILYISHSLGGIEIFTMSVVEEILLNPKIIQNYGEVLDFATFKKKTLKKQTQSIINVKNRHSPSSHSFLGKSTGAKIRGISSIRYTIIDDPIDLQDEENPDRATRQFLNWLRYKIIPLTRGGSIIIIGTRYSIKDLYVELGESRLYHVIKRSAITQIYPYTVNYPSDRPLAAADIQVEVEGLWELLAPSLWKDAYNGSAVQNILYELVSLGLLVFQQELQNNPIPLDPVIKYQWFNDYHHLTSPAVRYKWVVFVDKASGKTEAADYTAMVLVGAKDGKFYIHDIIYGKWTGKEKQAKLEQFITDSANSLGGGLTVRDIRLLIETVKDRDFFHRISHESWLTPRPINPAGRKIKQDRIVYGLGQEMENGNVYLFIDCRNKHQLKTECDGFPVISDEHIVDATDQAIYHLKTFKSKIKAGWL